MAQLIDSSIFIALERRGETLDALADVITSEPVALASITASELLVGVHLADNLVRRSRREAFVELIFESIRVLPFDLSVARVHAQLTSQLRSHPIGAHDLIIASTAVAFGYEVLTENLREFERIPELTVRHPNW